MPESLKHALDRSPVLLDGGLATLLESHGHDLSSDLWSARLLRDEPAAIGDAHREFFRHGAQVATTSSYQASFEGLATLGLDHDEGARLMRRSVDLACEARDEVRPDGWVAVSIGPYGAVLADGSEYRGDYDVDVAELRQFHRRRLAVLGQSVADGVGDVLALETIPCLAEVEALCAEIAGTGLPTWLSLSADGDHTRAGEPLAAAWVIAADVAEIIAIGVNCCDPREVGAAMNEAQPHGMPLVAYPNSGQGWDAVARAWTGESAFDLDAVTGWIDAGVRLVGGCCRVGPEQISQIGRLAQR